MSELYRDTALDRSKKDLIAQNHVLVVWFPEFEGWGGGSLGRESTVIDITDKLTVSTRGLQRSTVQDDRGAR